MDSINQRNWRVDRTKFDSGRRVVRRRRCGGRSSDERDAQAGEEIGEFLRVRGVAQGLLHHAHFGVEIVRHRDEDGEMIAINARHAQALSQARECLAEARQKLAGKDSIELLASDLRAALAAVGEICGRIDNERMLDQLFATFCIGK